MTNRFKGLDPRDRVSDDRWTLYKTQGSRRSPRKGNAKRAKWLSEEAFQIAKKRSKRQRGKGKIYPSECRVPKNSKER